MKIITLNLWGGKLMEEIEEFFKKYRNDIDVFCFQEVFNDAEDFIEDFAKDSWNPNLLTDLKKLLPDYYCVFDPVQEDKQGIATFVHKRYQINGIRSSVIANGRNTAIPREHGTIGRTILSVELENKDSNSLWISQFHGLWNGKGKEDCDERRRMVTDVNRHLLEIQASRRVLCGDFNLNPDTLAMAILRRVSAKDYVEKHKIKTTRSSYYEKIEESPYADYMMSTFDIHASNFEVLPDEVSDHLPLLLEF